MCSCYFLKYSLIINSLIYSEIFFQNQFNKFTCLIAVKKPCALKNPVIQKHKGFSSNIHFENCLFLSINSVNQNPRVEDSHEILMIFLLKLKLSCTNSQNCFIKKLLFPIAEEFLHHIYNPKHFSNFHSLL